MVAREAIYVKPDFSEEDGVPSAEPEAEFAEMNGYEAESGRRRCSSKVSASPNRSAQGR